MFFFLPSGNIVFLIREHVSNARFLSRWFPKALSAPNFSISNGFLWLLTMSVAERSERDSCSYRSLNMAAFVVMDAIQLTIGVREKDHVEKVEIYSINLMSMML